MKKIFTLIAVALFVAVKAMAAGYSRTLTDKFTVTGYVLKAYYNFQNNDPEVLPTTGDLRYRDGNVWGLHNFGSGGRSAAVSIPTSAGDLIVYQYYTSYPGSINVGTRDASLSSSTGYEVYKVAADAADVSTITFNAPRYGGFVACLVLAKDGDTPTYNYTINYVFNGSTIKSDTGSDEEGKEINASSTIVVNGMKYIATSENLSLTIKEGTNVLNVNVREAYSYNYSVVAKNGETTLASIANGSEFEGNNVTLGYPKYILNDGTLYETAHNGNDWYHMTFSLTQDNQTETVAYSPTSINNVVLYAEAEDLPGATSGNQNSSRTSKGLTGYGTNLPVTTLAPGKYKIVMHAANGNSAARAVSFNGGEVVLAEFTIAGSNNYQDFTSEEFTLFGNTDITLTSEGSQASGVDYIYIVKTGDAPTKVNIAVNEESNTASLVAPGNLDFTGSTLKAYVATAVTETSITLEEVTTVAAGQPIVVKGESCDVNVIAEAAAPAVNLFQTGAMTVAEGQNVYALGKADGQFHKVAEGVEIPAGKAYIVAGSTSAKTLALDFGGEATGISNATVAKQNTAAFNLMGQKVNANAKGIVIINGKKFNNK